MQSSLEIDMRRGPITILLILLAIVSTDSRSPRSRTCAEELNLQNIYGAGKVSARSFSGQWNETGHGYTVRNRRPSKEVEPTPSSAVITLVDAVSKTETVLFTRKQLTPEGSESALNVDSYAYSNSGRQVLLFANTKRVWRRNTRGDYWVLDIQSGSLRQLGSRFPESTLMFAKFSPDEDSVAYVQDRNIYLEDLETHEIRQLTRAKNKYIINGTSDWVNEEELSIRDGFRWSPDGRHIAFWQFNTENVPIMTMIDNTSNLYPELITFPYPKAGQQNSACRIGVVDIASRNTIWAKLKGNPRENYVARIQWAPASESSADRLIIQQLNRLQNRNRILSWTPEAQTINIIRTERDATWVDVHDELFWMNDGRHFTWITESDGWRRVCIVDSESGRHRLISPAGVDAIELLHISENDRLAYIIASPDNATQRYLYAASLDGKEWRRLSPMDAAGTHSYSISADGQVAIHTFSNMQTPPVTSLVRLPSHELLRVVESNAELSEFVTTTCVARTRFDKVDIGDGVLLDSWTIEPAEFESGKKYPLLVYVYGEPAGTTVRDRWMGSSYLWYQMLAQQGFIVRSFDNRGTPAPRGRAWRKHVYRKIGTIAASDQAAAVRQILADAPQIDPHRVGVWGWSGGGSMTLNAMFHYPDLYSTGISIAPVPDQKAYDTIYQERYMGLPKDNPEGFHDGSAINYCHQLKGNLLLIHGTGDDNCHYGTTEQLIDRMIEHNVPFDMMSYPNRTHAIKEGRNTTLHLRSLMTKYLQTHLGQ